MKNQLLSKTLSALMVIMLALVALPVKPAYAATLTVTNLNDTGAGSLRNQIAAAASGDTINFSVSGTINLTGNQITVGKNLTIDGTGQNVVINSNGGAGPTRRIFNVNTGFTLNLTNLTLSGGNINGGGNGGAVLLNGTAGLTINNVTFSGNTAAGGGGAIYNAGGTVTVTNSTFSTNSTGNNGNGGGAIYSNGGTVTVTSSTFSTNSTANNGGGGGAIFSNAGTTIISLSTFTSNTGTNRRGGALRLTTSAGSSSITNSTFYGNTTTSNGGAVSNEGGTLNIYNSTFSGNTATTGGGAINTNGGTVNVSNSIVANSTGTNCSGTVNNTATNINYGGTAVGNTCAAFTTPAANPLVAGAPANNGGTTFTIALSTGSGAIDAGTPSACSNVPVSNASQNGSTRPLDGNGVGGAVCDIGSYEAPAVVANTPPTGGNGTVTTNEDALYTFTVADFTTSTTPAYADAESNAFAGIQVTTLESAGTLQCGGVDVPLNGTCANVTTLTFLPAGNANGSPYATFSFKVYDGTSYSAASYTMTVNVTALNDAPTFTKGADQTVNEDSAAQTVVGWATAMNDGDPELNQTLTFNVTNNTNAALFSAGPVINATTGTLTYTPVANANGTATITITLSDNGSAVAPNVNTSVSQTFNINITAVNDIPSFTKGADQTVNEDAGAQTVAGWAPAISAGPANESAQVLTFNVTGNTNAALFSAAPAIAANGNLTFTPAANINGSATITITLSDNGSGAAPNVNTTAAQTFVINVTALNDAPTFTKGADQTVNEDSTAQTVVGWATAMNDGDPELNQTTTFNVTNNTNAALFSAGPVINATTGTLTYTPVANANGTATITITLSDNGSAVAPNVNTSVSQTFNINITAVNDIPSFTKGADQTVNEDAGAQTVAGWATAISAGPANEAAQTLTFNVTNNTNAALFSAGPTIAANGNLTFTPAANINGSATITITLSDNGSGVAPNVNTTASQTFVINVTALNDAPTFTKGADQTVNEDSAAQTVVGWATAMNDGDPELNQTLTFNVTNNTNAALFSAGPVINATTGTLTYTPVANANGTATITITLSDNGSAVAPNVNTSAAQTFVINITAVNDVPSFTKGADQTVLENAGAQTVAGWATGVSAGPANEAAQTLTFNVTNNTNAALFSAGPTIAANGDLTFTPATGVNGNSTITITLSDNGSGVAPNVNTTASQTFVINVTAVGTAPTFTKGADQTVNEDSAAQTVVGWATAMNDGDPELNQTLTFNVTNNTNAALFSAAPVINATTGTLTYTPAASANGTATITITLSDDGSNTPPNSNTSAAQTFIINVTAVNDVPSFTKGADQTVNEDAGAQTVTGWATGISSGPANESAQVLTFNVTNNTNAALFSAGPAIAANGDLTFTPAADANGTATITITLSDDGSGVAPNVNTTASQTFVINVTALNDAPTFTKGADQTVPENASGQTVAGWATAMNDGDPELNQTLAFNITGNTNPGLFSAAPVVNATTGTLTYTPAASANGSATITITLSDNGSGVAPNANTSASQTFVINVTTVNDAPSFTKGADQTVSEDAGAQTVVGWATAISAGPADESSQILTFNVTNNTNPGLFSVAPAIDAITGNLTFTSALNVNGSATITITLSDNGGNVAPSVDTSASQTFVITVTAVNDAPAFTSVPVTSVLQDSLYTYNITAVDIDGDPLTIVASTKPAWLTFTDNGNGAPLRLAVPRATAMLDQMQSHCVSVTVSSLPLWSRPSPSLLAIPMTGRPLPALQSPLRVKALYTLMLWSQRTPMLAIHW